MDKAHWSIPLKTWNLLSTDSSWSYAGGWQTYYNFLHSLVFGKKTFSLCFVYQFRLACMKLQRDFSKQQTLWYLDPNIDDMINGPCRVLAEDKQLFYQTYWGLFSVHLQHKCHPIPGMYLGYWNSKPVWPLDLMELL